MNRTPLYNLKLDSKSSRFQCISSTLSSSPTATQPFDPYSTFIQTSKGSLNHSLQNLHYSDPPNTILSNIILSLHSLYDQNVINSTTLSKIVSLLPPLDLSTNSFDTEPSSLSENHSTLKRHSLADFKHFQLENKIPFDNTSSDTLFNLKPTKNSQYKALPILSKNISPTPQISPPFNNNSIFFESACPKIIKSSSDKLEFPRLKDYCTHNNIATSLSNSPISSDNPIYQQSFDNIYVPENNNLQYDLPFENLDINRNKLIDNHNSKSNIRNTESLKKHIRGQNTEDDISIWNNSKEMLAKPTMLQNSAFDLSRDDFDLETDNNVYYYINDTDDNSNINRLNKNILPEKLNSSDTTINSSDFSANNPSQHTFNYCNDNQSDSNIFGNKETKSYSTLYSSSRIFDNRIQDSNKLGLSINESGKNSMIKDTNDAPKAKRSNYNDNSKINPNKTTDSYYVESSNGHNNIDNTYKKPLPKCPTSRNLNFNITNGSNFNPVIDKQISNHSIDYESSLKSENFPFYASILEDCYDQPENTILFQKGDIILVTDQIDKDWFLGALVNPSTKNPSYKNSGVVHRQFLLLKN
ncbi:hypothetical protein BB561_002242 [Smittium simulii]|uniref:SH3 domain-containing protein n=1 Tax=Smittium simulii TaxID=133385 RepID=A0A2T9YR89_9FUNG|nr:hypothetical protein BB561_002242 [Smittium simulii]